MSTSTALLEVFGKAELGSLSSYERGGKSGKPASVAGYRECRQSSSKRIRKERIAPKYCIESASLPTAMVQDSSRSAPTSTGPEPLQQSFTTQSTCLGRAPGAQTSRFKSQWQRLKLRAIMNCMAVESVHSPKSEERSENLVGEMQEPSESSSCFRASLGHRRNSHFGSTCDRTDSTVSSRIKALFSEAPTESRKTVNRLSAALTKMFRTHLLKLKSPAPVTHKKGNSTNSAEAVKETVPPPSPGRVHRGRRQEALVKMMERELAEHYEESKAAGGVGGLRTDSNARRTATEVIKHHTAPPRSTPKTAHKKSHKIRSRGSSKKGIHHKRCATF